MDDRRQLGAGAVALIGHHDVEDRPDAFDAFELARLEVLHPLVAPVEDVRRDDDELSLRTKLTERGESAFGILRSRFERARPGDVSRPAPSTTRRLP